MPLCSGHEEEASSYEEVPSSQTLHIRHFCFLENRDRPLCSGLIRMSLSVFPLGI